VATFAYPGSEGVQRKTVLLPPASPRSPDALRQRVGQPRPKLRRSTAAPSCSRSRATSWSSRGWARDHLYRPGAQRRGAEELPHRIRPRHRTYGL